jgi:membrane protease YdiL (CAAX protease family)
MIKTKRNLIIFIIVTLTSGWLGVLLDKVLTEQPEGDTLGMGLWLVAPFLTAVLLRVISRDRNGMGLKPDIKKNYKYYIAALFIFPAVTFIAVGLASVFGNVEFAGDTALLPPLIITSFFMTFVKNIFEEFAWRGYLTPKLMELQFNDWLLYIISGLVWALWHVPYYMVFLPDIYFVSTSRLVFTLTGILIMGFWNIMYVELYRLTKSVWAGVIMHAAEDALPTLLVIEGYLVFTKTGDTIFNPVTGIIATLLFLVIGFILRTIRKRNAE